MPNNIHHCKALIVSWQKLIGYNLHIINSFVLAYLLYDLVVRSFLLINYVTELVTLVEQASMSRMYGVDVYGNKGFARDQTADEIRSTCRFIAAYTWWTHLAAHYPIPNSRQWIRSLHYSRGSAHDFLKHGSYFVPVDKRVSRVVACSALIFWPLERLH